jgi:hypothetical protein
MSKGSDVTQIQFGRGLTLLRGSFSQLQYKLVTVQLISNYHIRCFK